MRRRAAAERGEAGDDQGGSGCEGCRGTGRGRGPRQAATRKRGGGVERGGGWAVRGFAKDGRAKKGTFEEVGRREVQT